MPFLLIAFPVFDPVAISLGPFAIKWYALAYIGGIVFGWVYARALIKNQKLWGGPAPITLTQMDDFILWVTIGIIVGGRTGYVLFYNLPFFIQHPLAIFKLWEGGMSFHGGFLGCVAAVMLFARMNNIPILSLGDITTAVAPVGLLLGLHLTLNPFIAHPAYKEIADKPFEERLAALVLQHARVADVALDLDGRPRDELPELLLRGGRVDRGLPRGRRGRDGRRVCYGIGAGREPAPRRREEHRPAHGSHPGDREQPDVQRFHRFTTPHVAACSRSVTGLGGGGDLG